MRSSGEVSYENRIPTIGFQLTRTPSGLDHRFNTWIPREELLEKGFGKLVQQFDDLESSREGAGQRDTSAHIVRKHLEDIGLDGDIAQYNEIAGLSGGPFNIGLHTSLLLIGVIAQARRSSSSSRHACGTTLRCVHCAVRS